MTNTIFENAADRIIDIAKRFASALDQAGIPYRVVGGLAVFLHVDRIAPIAARMTRDVDVAIERRHLAAIQKAVEPYGFKYRHVAGIDMFVDAGAPKARNAVHAIFVGERVRPQDPAVIPGSEPVPTEAGILIAPVVDLVRMKLTSFRLKDKVHIQDMDSVGLITPEIEESLPELLRERLREVRAAE
ncbi:MAG TPA: hypothetical protein VFW83_04080 [Bryobacteraceae bacterium]|nr:hypothetical protein [Bryobacteraceae bacterium]